MLHIRRALACAALLAGCAPAKAPTPAAAPQAQAQLTLEPKVTPVASDDELSAARSTYEALPLDAPDRAARRAAIEKFLLGQANRALDGHHLEDAWEPLKQCFTLYDADELTRSPKDAPLLAAVERAEQALRRRGQHQEVIAALAVELSLAGTDAARRRFDEVAAWLRAGASGASDDPTSPDGRERVIEDLEATARLWPSPFVIDQLRSLYFERPESESSPLSRRMRRGADLRELLQGGQRNGLAYELMRLYLRVSRPEAAAAALKQLENKPGDDAQLRELLVKYTASTAHPGDAIQIAMTLAASPREDRDVAERVCRDASRRFPTAPEPRLCVGQLAMSLGQLGVATASFEDAVRLEPARREAWEMLGQLYLGRLKMLVSDENLDVNALEPQLARMQTFYSQAEKQFPGKPLRPSMAETLFEVGRGYFNGGKVSEALKYLERSVALEPSAAAIELLGQIALKKDDGKKAAALFERAAALRKSDRVEELFWRAKLRRELGDALESIGDAQAADSARRAAIADWDTLTGAGNLIPEAQTEAGLERAKLLYQLGERDDALAQFEKAIDAQPDRGSTYADVIAFLVARGELEEALDAYHRALGRSEVTDYLKVYCSLWIVDLARRSGQPEDPLATAYLKSTDGAKWYDDLARWATGRETEQALVEHADTPARKAEASFYRAMRALETGRTDEARGLWKQVLDTEMMAFFEFDMAQLYLKSGAPSQPMLQGKPVKPKATPSAQRPPDGSI
jgi:tetratricopeptide (TPR) repeat protein